MAAVTIVVPTRNEAATVPELVGRATSALARHSIDGQILFVDDSDDETTDILNSIEASNGLVKVLHRAVGFRYGGLAGAVTEGIGRSSSDVIAVMDGDLQHPPELLGALILPVLQGEAQVAVATRYASSGSSAGLAGPMRTAVSRLSRLAVHAALPSLRSISDPLGGFFALRSDLMIGKDISPEGFKILLEILASTDWAHAVEVPYRFLPRGGGASKASFRTGVCFGRQLGRLAWEGTSSRRAGTRVTLQPEPFVVY